MEDSETGLQNLLEQLSRAKKQREAVLGYFQLSANKKPIKAKDFKTLRIDHSDPTGRGILFYERAEDIVLSGELKPKCKSTVKEKKEFIEGQFPQIASVTCRS